MLGVPAKKAQNTLLDIDQHVLDKVRLINTIDDICFADLECSNLFVSIDIDVLNCRQEKLTALEYCPNTILSMFSKLNLNSTSNVESEVKSCIFVKNQLGYSDLYKSGENNINVDYLIKTIKMLKQRCDKFDVEFGITSQQRRIVGEITELNGFDYGNNVYNLMNRLINIFESLF